MNSTKYVFALVLFSFFFMFCQQKEIIQEEEIVPTLKLRIENATDIKLDSIISNNHYFGTLESGEASNYVEFDQIYQWPNVSCKDDERGYIWDSGVDSIGFWMSFYTEGNYTLVITGIAVNSPVLVEAYVRID